MGWDGVGYRVSPADLDIIARSSDWVRHLYEARKHFLLDRSHPRNGFVDPQLCWDDMPPASFDRRRRVHGGRSTIVSITPNDVDELPAVLSESLWSAIEGGRAIITTRTAHDMASLMALQHPEEENQQIQELGSRAYAEIRRRVVDNGRLDNSAIIGDEEPIVIRQCTFSSCEFRHCEFRNVEFRQCSFVKSVFSACAFVDCLFEDCDWAETVWGEWGTKTVVLKGPEASDRTREGAVQKRRLLVDWRSRNNVTNSTVRGYANSLHGARGIGAAAFMPGRLNTKYTKRVQNGETEVQRLQAEHREKMQEEAAKGQPLTVQAKARLFAKREQAKSRTIWKASTKQDDSNPAYFVRRLREQFPMEDELSGFEFAV